MRYVLKFIVFISILSINHSGFSQISPGPLTSYHSYLEGLSNCTHCHDIGKKVTNTKCLECHKDLKLRIDQQKGYHSSVKVKGKECLSCHNEHHGLNFQIIKFDKSRFDHQLTGFKLNGAHFKLQCTDCHKVEFILSPELKKKKFTYMGLGIQCLDCHKDYHRKTLSEKCQDCHGFESFKPVVNFNHDRAKFKLLGSHQKVECIQCHRTEIRDNKKFQVFTGLSFKSCSSCHTDVHQNKFGQNCSQCHTETSFQVLKTDNTFNHNKTNFALEGKHTSLKCVSCHKSSVTAPLKHSQCSDCHKDYHKGELTKKEGLVDCSACHTPKGFTETIYSMNQHNQSQFPLLGSHIATPCTACHKKKEQWHFKNIGFLCNDCHKDIHDPLIQLKYYPGSDCQFCHNPDRWNQISFDHSKTNFVLKGAHQEINCKKCHFRVDNNGLVRQKFSGLSALCTECHTDQHNSQFDENGNTSCERCHQFESWKITDFNHNKTAFRLDGKHQLLSCEKCHFTVQKDNKSFILYKTGKTKCEDCHS